MNEAGAFVEIQGTAEGHALLRSELDRLLELAAHGIDLLHTRQREVLNL
jgi:ribonuclease PH